MCEHGAILVGVTERTGSIYNSKGINPDELKTYLDSTALLEDFPGCEKHFHTNEAMYEPCDIFAPALTESSVNAEDAEKL
jgi:glutamate dehydrogenase/leucine dehydrogenase